ncbi:MAG TPA: PQQ-binding-like beta-propeller repeat protein [Fimbriimonadaceae bacterium]|nr:PQQ-binding-like beta-propeller repeat protein [Fimbriimonadaceae bacterium]
MVWAAFVLGLGQSLIQPPFVKAWEGRGDFVNASDSFTTSLTALFAGGYGHYSQINPLTGKNVWRKEFKWSGGCRVEFRDGKVYVALDGGNGEGRPGAYHYPELRAVDPNDGRTLWSVKLKGQYPSMAVGRNFACVKFPPDQFTGVDLQRHRIRWSKKLAFFSDRNTWGFERFVAAGDVLINAVANGKAIALKGKDGSVAWTWSPASRHYQLLDANDSVALFAAPKSPLVALDVRTGRRRWSNPALDRVYSGRIEGSRALLALDDATLATVSLKDGSVRARTKLSEPVISDLSESPSAAKHILARTQNTVLAFDLVGKPIWSYPVADFGAPIYANGRAIVLGDFYPTDHKEHREEERLSLFGLKHGNPPTLPTELAARKAYARRLARDWIRLTTDQKRDMAKLGRDAFDALFDELVVAARENEKPRLGLEGGSWYSAVQEIARLLLKTAEPSDSARFLDAIATLNPNNMGRDAMLGILAEKGDFKLTTPLFVKLVKAAFSDQKGERGDLSVAMEGLTSSPEPEAVNYLISALNDPNAPPELRQEAYVNLARSGGEAGLTAVLAHQDFGTGIAPLEERMELEKLPADPPKGDHRERGESSLVAARTLPDGRRYGLVESSVLGCYADLYTVEWKDGRWRHPLFTGFVASAEYRGDDAARKKAQAEIREVLNGGWIKRFVDKPKLAADADGDGLTDLEEARLGTDPDKRDSDGDGIDDLHDRDPLFPERALSDDDLAVRAAFEARYKFTEHPNLFFVDFSGCKPQKLSAQGGYIVPGGKAELFGLGPAYVTVTLEPKPAPNGDRTVRISTTYAGLNGTGYKLIVRKFGEHWAVISSNMEWIS